jgi:hypothetical protein
MRVPVALDARIVRGLLHVPAVKAEIEFSRRVFIVRAARVLMHHGLSQNHTADGLHVSRSRLSVWLATAAREGEESLRPAPWNAGRKPVNGRARRRAAFLEFCTSP